MNKNYKNIDSRFHPYRDKYYTMKKNKHLDKKKVKISTTGQILLNMTDKEFIYFQDLVKDLELDPIYIEYQVGKLVGKNLNKYHLCKMFFYRRSIICTKDSILQIL